MENKVINALNEQVVNEFYSSYLYLSMSAWTEKNGLKGAGNWLRVQFLEEQAHALHMFDYIKDRGGDVHLESISKPKTDWVDIVDLFKDVQAHEKHVTQLINNLYSIALESKDHAAVAFLQWFVNEQVEEEKNVQDILDQLKLIGNNGSGLYMLDKELAARTFVAPTFGAGL